MQLTEGGALQRAEESAEFKKIVQAALSGDDRAFSTFEDLVGLQDFRCGYQERELNTIIAIALADDLYHPHALMLSQRLHKATLKKRGFDTVAKSYEEQVDRDLNISALTLRITLYEPSEKFFLYNTGVTSNLIAATVYLKSLLHHPRKTPLFEAAVLGHLRNLSKDKQFPSAAAVLVSYRLEQGDLGQALEYLNNLQDNKKKAAVLKHLYQEDLVTACQFLFKLRNKEEFPFCRFKMNVIRLYVHFLQGEGEEAVRVLASSFRYDYPFDERETAFITGALIELARTDADIEPLKREHYRYHAQVILYQAFLRNKEDRVSRGMLAKLLADSETDPREKDKWLLTPADDEEESLEALIGERMNSPARKLRAMQQRKRDRTALETFLLFNNDESSKAIGASILKRLITNRDDLLFILQGLDLQWAVESSASEPFQQLIQQQLEEARSQDAVYFYCVEEGGLSLLPVDSVVESQFNGDEIVNSIISSDEEFNALINDALSGDAHAFYCLWVVMDRCFFYDYGRDEQLRSIIDSTLLENPNDAEAWAVRAVMLDFGLWRTQAERWKFSGEDREASEAAYKKAAHFGSINGQVRVADLYDPCQSGKATITGYFAPFARSINLYDDAIKRGNDIASMLGRAHLYFVEKANPDGKRHEFEGVHLYRRAFRQIMHTEAKRRMGHEHDEGIWFRRFEALRQYESIARIVTAFIIFRCFFNNNYDMAEKEWLGLREGESQSEVLNLLCDEVKQWLDSDDPNIKFIAEVINFIQQKLLLGVDVSFVELQLLQRVKMRWCWRSGKEEKGVALLESCFPLDFPFDETELREIIGVLSRLADDESSPKWEHYRELAQTYLAQTQQLHLERGARGYAVTPEFQNALDQKAFTVALSVLTPEALASASWFFSFFQGESRIQSAISICTVILDRLKSGESLSAIVRCSDFQISDPRLLALVEQQLQAARRPGSTAVPASGAAAEPDDLQTMSGGCVR